MDGGSNQYHEMVIISIYYILFFLLISMCPIFLLLYIEIFTYV
jgi:hypothetical protein